MIEEKFAVYNDSAVSGEFLFRQLAEAAYTQNTDGDLLTVAEPWDNSRPAPLFWAGMSVSGRCSLLFRNGVSEELRKQARTLAEKYLPGDLSGQIFFAACSALFPDSRPEAAYSFWVPPLETAEETILLKAGTFPCQIPSEFQWIHEELSSIPGCCAAVRDGYVVSLCRSVRIGGCTEEAGIETLPAYRGQRLAMAVLAAWANNVRNRRKIPLYSTSFHNFSSQRVAKNAGLQLIGRQYTLTE